MIQGFDNIEHVVVVMMENRSFDNLLGWLYADVDNHPPVNIPEQNPTTFDGLTKDGFFNQAADGTKVFVSHPPTGWPPQNNPTVVPTPDPNEEFVNITEQIFGTKTPAPDAKADMSGFLKNYGSIAGAANSAGQIMQTFGPGQANVINALARSFAVCDAWFASCPCQTWPNRGFVHTGSSDGHVNNDNYELYDIRTIFNVLEDKGVTWGVFHNTTLVPSLTWGQFLPQIAGYVDHFANFSSFLRRCSATNDQKLPAYSFVEPRFTPELGLFKVDYPNDYHPPHNICRGEQFLAQVYGAIRSSPYRDNILLVITFDEHGGCYDHVPPPTGAAAPEPGATSRDGSFHFDRYGVRVPALVVSSYVEPGTVFRANAGEAPYDHTSILATLRDWQGLDRNPHAPFLPSPRIKAAPTLQRVLKLSNAGPINPWPDIQAKCSIDGRDESLDTPLNSVQKSLLATAKRDESSGAVEQQVTAVEAKTKVTYADGLAHLYPAVQ